jgi:hypothetical protein
MCAGHLKAFLEFAVICDTFSLQVNTIVNCPDFCKYELMEAISNCSVCEVQIFLPHSMSLCMTEPLYSWCSLFFTVLVLEYQLV